LINQGVPALGSMTIGGVAEHFGLQWPVAVGAALCLFLGVWVWRKRDWMAKALGAEEAPIEVRDKTSGGAG
jgi:predicted MFS family arabinose efflux permease